jgi:hypothetical protein
LSSSLKILIIGGYGTFGGRITALLENEPRLNSGAAQGLKVE